MQMQFSLKSLFIGITSIAVLCGVAFAPPQFIGFVVLGLTLLFALPALISGSIYMRGKWQAFCIGGASMTLIVLSTFRSMSLAYGNPFYELSGDDEQLIIAKLYLAILWIL